MRCQSATYHASEVRQRTQQPRKASTEGGHRLDSASLLKRRAILRLIYGVGEHAAGRACKALGRPPPRAAPRRKAAERRKRRFDQRCNHRNNRQEAWAPAKARSQMESKNRPHREL